MKTCQCCGASAAADAPHCARCGEASWKAAPSIIDGQDTSPSAAQPIVIEGEGTRIAPPGPESVTTDGDEDDGEEEDATGAPAPVDTAHPGKRRRRSKKRGTTLPS